ncbi:uncharacterized protein LOC122060060 isoform X2 [Macadamia integrifolia]|uniref:uncharacterized protein LOC122060060 isoform X2 n=1 Tax=Macadamia integrifolia TaxID=60698 RepID=UPI001C5296AA|nr:uncharacterized protein LOC122060060 isoform X2 [Macadamia integrifolia]
MDPSSVQSTPSVEEDEWDTEGFVIPSLVGDSSKPDVPQVNDLKPSPKVKKEEEKIYLGPHGAPPSQAKQQELNASGRKQRFKQKLKEADRKHTGSGRENKVDSLRELVGGGKVNVTRSKGSSRDWLDPQCHESQV